MKKQPTNVNRQHTVPKFLLKKFSFSRSNSKPEDDKQLVNCYDKKRQLSYPASVEDASVNKHFYNDSDNLSLETSLSFIEDKAAPVIDIIVREKSLKNINNQQKEILCEFAIVQKLRSTNDRLLIKKLHEIFNANQPMRNNEDNESRLKDLHLDILSKSSELIGSLLKKELLLYQAPLDSLYFISDNPITLHNELERSPHRSNMGLDSYGIQIHLPISSNFTLVFFCEKASSDIRKLLETKSGFETKAYQDLIKLLGHLNNGSPMQQALENVEFQNYLQVKNSERFIYCKEPNFTLANEMINEDSKYSHGPRLNY